MHDSDRNHQIQRPYAADYEFSLAEILRRFMEHKLLIIAVTFGCSVVGFATSFLVDRVYDAEVLIHPVDHGATQGGLAALSGQLGGIASLAGIDLRSGPSRNEEWLALLESKAFTQKFIEENELMPILFSDHWDPREIIWRVQDGDEPTMNEAVEVFSKLRNVRRIPRGDLVVLRIGWTEPEIAARWANQLVERLNQHVRSLAIDQAQNSLTYLENELENTNIVEIRLGIYRMIESQIQTIMFANVQPDFAFRVVDQAIVLDKDKYSRPNRLLFALTGFLLGLAVAFFTTDLKKDVARSRR